MIGTSRTFRSNLCTNPDAVTDTTGWTNVSLTTFERVTSLPTVAGLPAGITTGFHGVGDANADRAQIGFTAVAGRSYRYSAYVRLASLSATSIFLQLTGTATGTLASSTYTTVGGDFTQLYINFVAGAAETVTCRVNQSGAGASDFHFTRAEIRTRSPQMVVV